MLPNLSEVVEFKINLDALAEISGFENEVITKYIGLPEPYIHWEAVATTYFFTFHPKLLFSLLITDNNTIEMGADYLKIIGISQVFMCIEMLTTGAFHGWGKTTIPATISVIFNVLRIPAALFFISSISNQVSSVWWSISLSSIAKGIIMTMLFTYLLKSFINKKSTVQ